jgi:hypothetical protein
MFWLCSRGPCRARVPGPRVSSRVACDCAPLVPITKFEPLHFSPNPEVGERGMRTHWTTLAAKRSSPMHSPMKRTRPRRARSTVGFARVGLSTARWGALRGGDAAVARASGIDTRLTHSFGCRATMGSAVSTRWVLPCHPTRRGTRRRAPLATRNATCSPHRSMTRRGLRISPATVRTTTLRCSTVGCAASWGEPRCPPRSVRNCPFWNDSGRANPRVARERT